MSEVGLGSVVPLRAAGILLDVKANGRPVNPGEPAPQAEYRLSSPGYFKASTATRTTPITLMAQYPAVDDAATPINLGKHTVIDSGVVSAPAAGPLAASR